MLCARNEQQGADGSLHSCAMCLIRLAGVICPHGLRKGLEVEILQTDSEFSMKIRGMEGKIKVLMGGINGDVFNEGLAHGEVQGRGTSVSWSRSGREKR